uniref:uncharacterized protein LOC105351207 n=1 Tax=Fragaria vesca subsp. vesca TaxID=101020 RepID=UPI0005CA42FE|nr:PREDICTED: uncharacterized protein LOC105351207 [Fragaria vesca subsp. vesca]
MERTVSEVLRKLVRKYSGKRPDVIHIAMENPAAVLADEVSTRLSGKSHVGYDRSALRKVNDGNLNKSRSTRTQSDEAKDNIELQSSTIEKDFEEEPNDIWNAMVKLSAGDKLAEDKNDLVLQEENLKKDDPESTERTSPSKPVKRNKWKPEEVKKFIKMRGKLHSRFQVVKGRMALWEEISRNLLAEGINRSPGQCKSLWASLVQKYEESKSGKRSQKSWPYYEEMDGALSDSEAMATK